jgi:chromosome segregation ATPase
MVEVSMEELINLLPKQPSSPRLWIERLAIFSELKTDHCIRSIGFRRGLNVIWAHEPASGTHTGIHAAGHGVGKTSLCLLIRYCLGDYSKSVTTLKDELSGEFPNGGVGMVIHVEGQAHSLFRYFNAYREGLVVAGSDLDSLIENGIGQQTYKEFESYLATAIMSKVSPQAIPETEQAIEWRHLLAWLTRDQGARFKSFFAWREGEGIGFQRSRQDPPIVMRAVLGLMEQEETQLLVHINSLEKALKRSEQETERLKQEPNLIRRRIESDLRAWLQVGDDLPLRTDDIFKESVESKINDLKQKSQAVLAAADNELDQLNDRLLKLRFELLELEKQYKQADEDYQLYDKAREQNEDSVRKINTRCETLRGRVGMCQDGNVYLQECTHIKDEINKLESAVNLRDRRDQSTLSVTTDNWAGRASVALNIRESLKPQLERLKSEISSLLQDCKPIQLKRDSALLEVNRGANLLKELERWEKVFGSPEAAEMIRQSEKNIKKINDDIGFARLRLQLSQADRTNRQLGLGRLMNSLVLQLFSDDTIGSFVIRDEYYPFQLSVNGGEAYYVLEVLLGDLACLLDSPDPSSAFPGFLIHDCPREADMSPVLYEKLLSLMQQIEQQAYADQVPFQYILTTTSPPPSLLRELPYLRVTLDPSTDNGLLFRRRFQTIRQSGYVFGR